jgi:hypothetical protein
MYIEQVFAAVVGGKDTLRNRFLAEAANHLLTSEQANSMFSIIPEPLANADAFLDKMTGLWRYEFGLPYDIAQSLVWGTHMWAPVENLFAAISSAHARLPTDRRAAYLQRLADPDTHQATLVEMIPAYKVSAAVPVEFEVAGLGDGNRTVDWVIGPHMNRTVLLDVKRRTTDFISQMVQMSVNGAEAPPNHDPALLFRSVEQKFISIEPDVQLQGVWIHTNIKQDEDRLLDAYADMDESKVHFAILGDWKPDAYVLVRREQDRRYLIDLFQIEPSSRFTFKNPNTGQ